MIQYKVVIDEQGWYTIMFETERISHGAKDTGFRGTQSECRAFIGSLKVI